MQDASRPLRSVLYIPGSNQRALDKARTLAADAIIFDLEDAVAPDVKDAARSRLRETIAAGGYGGRMRIIRINGLDTPWGDDDLKAFAPAGVDAILLPKVDGAGLVAGVAERIAALGASPGTALWAMMETPRGVLNAAAIAAAPRMGGFVMGTNDLAKELGSRARADRLPMMAALQACLLAARASGLVCIDGVFNAFRDADGLQAECEQGRDLGMDGKTLIHPAQIDIANAVFAPTSSELDLARRYIAAFDEARAKGDAVAVVDGKIVENLHVETARAVLAKASAIAELEIA